MIANLQRALVTVVDDAFFGVTATSRLDLDGLRALARRRAPAVVSALRDGSSHGMELGDAWLLTLCAAIAPISPPRWLPMNEVVGELSLEHGARGVRSLFTTKPSDKEVARVRRAGSFAVRALGAVLASDGEFHADARLVRATLVASLGLPEEDQRLLDAEQPIAADALDPSPDLEPKVARGVLRGAFQAAIADGLDPREEQAIAAVARKVGLALEDLNAARTDARQAIDGSKPFGEAACEAIRYLLADQPAEAEQLAIAAARLSLPPVHRREVVTAINVGGTVALGRKHQVERKQREGVLALAWLAALRQDPPVARRAELALRHDQVAADLGAPEVGIDVRAGLDRLVESELVASLA
jgi:tellurite resistance protein